MATRTKPKADTATETLDIQPLGRDEMNLAEFPISVLADRAAKGTKTLVFSNERGTLTVTGSDAYGLPTALDADVIVALIQLTKKRNDFTHETVNFSRYELLRWLGWANEGKSYRRLDEALNRWTGVTLFYDGTWWDNRAKRYVDAKMHILETVISIDGKVKISGDEQQSLPLSSFTWNKLFMESCRADNLKRLNLEAYFSLQHPSSKRLYRFLDKRFYHRPDWIFDLKEIAFERVGLSRNYGHNVAKIKEKLQPAIDELEGLKFLEPLTREQRFFKEGTAWKVRLDQKIALPAPLTSSPSEEPDPLPLLTELTSRGITKKTAAELMQQFPAESIQSKVEVFDWLKEQKDKRIAKSPSGYLVKSIKDGYAVPEGFTPRAEREKLGEAKRQHADELANQKRQEQEKTAAEKAKDKRDTDHWESLTSLQQEELQAKADAEADAAELARQFGSLKRMGQTIRRRNFIRRLLDSLETPPLDA